MHILVITSRVCSGPQLTRSFPSDLATKLKFNNSDFMAIEFLHHQAQHLDDQEAGDTHGLRPSGIFETFIWVPRLRNECPQLQLLYSWNSQEAVQGSTRRLFRPWMKSTLYSAQSPIGLDHIL